VGAAAEQLRWRVWDSAEPARGWTLRIAVEHTDTGRAWVLDARDAGGDSVATS
jgi:hypothetical protein